MLRLDLSEIVRTVGMNHFCEIDEPPFVFDDIEFISPVKGNVTISNSGELLIVRGSFKSTISLECARCLADVRQPIDGDILEQFAIIGVEDSPRRDEAPAIVQDEDNEMPEGLFEGLVIDLRVLIRQSAILNAPLNVLCREDCKGLCPSCGKNRNLISCDCSFEATNRPFASLPELFRQKDTE